MVFLSWRPISSDGTMVRYTLVISDRVFLDQKHVSLVNGAIYSRERSVFFMWNNIKEEDRKKVLFSLKPVALTASLCRCPIPSLSAPVFCSSCIQMGCLIQHILPAIQLHKKATLPSLPLSCLSVPVLGLRAALAGRTSTYRGIEKSPSSPTWKDTSSENSANSVKPLLTIWEDDVLQPWHQAKCMA